MEATTTAHEIGPFSSANFKPLHPLSPERVNGTRPPSTTSPTTKTTTTDESDYNEAVYSAHSSPSRKHHPNPFHDSRPGSASGNQVSGFVLPQSPSLPEIHSIRRGGHGRTNSDVQGLVKRFEHLDVRDRDAESSEKRKRLEAELRRAQIAREEAESDVKRLREEGRRLKKEGDEGRERERKVGKRLETVMEELGAAKETYASQSAVYEKELRKARKEAFKSSSAVLKVQDELKSTRNSLRITQSGLDHEKEKVHRKEQERFEMEYRLIPLQEQLEKLQQQLKVVEEERDGLKTNLKEEEVARVAAEGMIALPTSQECDDEFNSPKKSPRKRPQSPLSDDKENLHTTARKDSESRRLVEDLDSERMRREHAEELADFLQMECKFQCCSCKIASRLGHDATAAFDAELEAGMQKIREGMAGILSPPEGAAGHDQTDVLPKDNAEGEELERVNTVEIHRPQEDEDIMQEDVPADEQDEDLAIDAEASKPLDEPTTREEAPIAPRPTPINTEATTPPPDAPNGTTTTVPLQPSSPQTPQNHQLTTPFRRSSIRTVTTTTTVPMHFTPVAKPHLAFTPENQENVPPTGEQAVSDEPSSQHLAGFDRAAALAAIEYRRGRARSFASGHVTPRKQMVEGVKERRDVSAPALGGKVGGGVAQVKGTGSVGRAMGRRGVL